MLVVQTILTGIAFGFNYSLIALGYTLTFGILGFHTFSHGHIAMVATFVPLILLTLGMPFGIAFIVALITGAAAGVLIYFVCFRLLRQPDPMASLISTIGVALFLEEFIIMIFGPDNLTFPAPFQMLIFNLGPLYLRGSYVIIMAVSAICMVGLFALVYFTKLGRAMRTIAFSEDIAHLTGVNVFQIVVITFAFGSALAGVAGVLLASVDNVTAATIGGPIVLKGLIVIVLGGLGNLLGALVAGIGLGVIEMLGQFFVGPELRDMIAFILLFAVLVLRPQGLFRR